MKVPLLSRTLKARMTRWNQTRRQRIADSHQQVELCFSLHSLAMAVRGSARGRKNRLPVESGQWQLAQLGHLWARLNDRSREEEEWNSCTFLWIGRKFPSSDLRRHWGQRIWQHRDISTALRLPPCYCVSSRNSVSWIIIKPRQHITVTRTSLFGHRSHFQQAFLRH